MFSVMLVSLRCQGLYQCDYNEQASYYHAVSHAHAQSIRSQCLAYHLSLQASDMHHVCWSIRFNIRFIRSNEQSFLVLWNLSASSVFFLNGIALHLPSTHMPFLRWTLVSRLLACSLDHTNELVNSFRRSEQTNFFVVSTLFYAFVSCLFSNTGLCDSVCISVAFSLHYLCFLSA